MFQTINVQQPIQSWPPLGKTKQVIPNLLTSKCTAFTPRNLSGLPIEDLQQDVFFPEVYLGDPNRETTFTTARACWRCRSVANCFVPCVPDQDWLVSSRFPLCHVLSLHGPPWCVDRKICGKSYHHISFPKGRQKQAAHLIFGENFNPILSGTSKTMRGYVSPCLYVLIRNLQQLAPRKSRKVPSQKERTTSSNHFFLGANH